MAQTIILVAGNTALRSDEVIVTDTPVSLAIFVSVGGQIPRGTQLALERKIGSVWQPVYDHCGSAIYMSDRMMDLTLYGPGTYSLLRAANAVMAVGAVADDAT